MRTEVHPVIYFKNASLETGSDGDLQHNSMLIGSEISVPSLPNVYYYFLYNEFSHRVTEKFVVAVTRSDENQSCTLSLVSGKGRVTCQYLVHGKVNKVCLVR